MAQHLSESWCPGENMMVIICFERNNSLFFAAGARSDALAGGGRGRFKNSSRG
jgi:hypothetical protein